MIKKGVFNTSYTYDIYVTVQSTSFGLWAGPSSAQTILSTVNTAGYFKSYFIEGFTLNSAANTDLYIGTPNPNGNNVFRLKRLKVVYTLKPEIQDSDMTWAGRRTSYFEGTKITSLDINVDSPDTIDGGPVVVINTVNSDTPTTPNIPLQTATERQGRALVNIGGQPVVISTEGRALVNVAGQPIPQTATERQGRALVNVSTEPVIPIQQEARALANFIPPPPEGARSSD